MSASTLAASVASATPARGVNRRVVLRRHPSGLPSLEDFRLETGPLPSPGEGQVLLRTVFLSLDPYMRNLMDPVGPAYAPAVEPGQPMVGGTVSRVIDSRHPAFSDGQLVLANGGWQDFSLSDGSDLLHLPDADPPSVPLSLTLGGLGMTGFTGWYGLREIGRPRAGQTVVVAAATGAVGAIVGQLARLDGARVVGIAGGPDKCRHATAVLGFDACIDRHAPAWEAQLARACPAGIDVYFESVGGEVLSAVLPLLNPGARIPLCGFIAHYNDTPDAAGRDRLPALLAAVLGKRIRMEGFIILDHYDSHFATFQREMTARIANGEVHLDEVRIAGLEQAPAAFIDLLQGRHLGKLVVEVAD